MLDTLSVSAFVDHKISLNKRFIVMRLWNLNLKHGSLNGVQYNLIDVTKRRFCTMILEWAKAQKWPCGYSFVLMIIIYFLYRAGNFCSFWFFCSLHYLKAKRKDDLVGEYLWNWALSRLLFQWWSVHGTVQRHSCFNFCGLISHRKYWNAMNIVYLKIICTNLFLLLATLPLPVPLHVIPGWTRLVYDIWWLIDQRFDCEINGTHIMMESFNKQVLYAYTGCW